jgi:hypothetical protein
VSEVDRIRKVLDEPYGGELSGPSSLRFDLLELKGKQIADQETDWKLR